MGGEWGCFQGQLSTPQGLTSHVFRVTEVTQGPCSSSTTGLGGTKPPALLKLLENGYNGMGLGN